MQGKYVREGPLPPGVELAKLSARRVPNRPFPRQFHGHGPETHGGKVPPETTEEVIADPRSIVPGGLVDTQTEKPRPGPDHLVVQDSLRFLDDRCQHQGEKRLRSPARRFEIQDLVAPALGPDRGERAAAWASGGEHRDAVPEVV